MEAALASFFLVALTEMGDKTQLLAFSLVARFGKPGPVFLGIFLATVANHLLASTVGSWVAAQIPPKVMALTLGLTFILFGLWALKPDTLEKQKTKPHTRLGVVLSTMVLFFFIEMGDKTQLATIALAARYHSVFWVTLGTTAGMLFSDGLAVFLGRKLSHHLPMNLLRQISAVIFFIFGALSLYAMRTQAG